MVSRAAIAGFHNYTEAQHYLYGVWREKISGTFTRHGFVKFYPRPAEEASALRVTGGISNQIFDIGRMNVENPSEAETGLALPYDRTVPLAFGLINMFKTLFFHSKDKISVSLGEENGLNLADSVLSTRLT